MEGKYSKFFNKEKKEAREQTARDAEARRELLKSLTEKFKALDKLKTFDIIEYDKGRRTVKIKQEYWDSQAKEWKEKFAQAYFCLLVYEQLKVVHVWIENFEGESLGMFSEEGGLV